VEIYHGRQLMYFLNNGKLCEKNENRLELENEYDVVVVGGGVAGIAAAIAASSAGCSTLIIEAGPAFGGLATLGLVNIPLDFVSGIGRMMFDDLKTCDGIWHRNTDPEKHKLVLDRMLERSGVSRLLYTWVVDALMDGDKISGVVIQTKTGRKAIGAKRVIDCSGDSDISYYAGAETFQGRREDGMSQACSLEFRLGGVNWEKFAVCDIKMNDPKWVRLIAEDLKSGELSEEVDNHLNWLTHLPGRPEKCGMDEVSICFAHSRNCYPIDHWDLTRMYIEGREQCNMLADYIKRRIPGFEDSFLVDTAPLLGVRESRRIAGEYILTAEDVAGQKKFDDVVAISSHGYDIHNFEGPGNIKWAPIEINGETRYVISNAMGFGTTTLPPGNAPLMDIHGNIAVESAIDRTGFYDIPYRSLIPARIDNLLVAGRNLSSDIYAQSGARLIMACLTMGEAAGVATAISLHENIVPRKINRLQLQKVLISRKVNIGQNFRKIPGLNSNEKLNDEYLNPEFDGDSRKNETTAVIDYSTVHLKDKHKYSEQPQTVS
jgi:hypothetical protein